MSQTRIKLNRDTDLSGCTVSRPMPKKVKVGVTVRKKLVSNSASSAGGVLLRSSLSISLKVIQS